MEFTTLILDCQCVELKQFVNNEAPQECPCRIKDPRGQYAPGDPGQIILWQADANLCRYSVCGSFLL